MREARRLAELSDSNARGAKTRGDPRIHRWRSRKMQQTGRPGSSSQAQFAGAGSQGDLKPHTASSADRMRDARQLADQIAGTAKGRTLRGNPKRRRRKGRATQTRGNPGMRRRQFREDRGAGVTRSLINRLNGRSMIQRLEGTEECARGFGPWRFSLRA